MDFQQVTSHGFGRAALNALKAVRAEVNPYAFARVVGDGIMAGKTAAEVANDVLAHVDEIVVDPAALDVARTVLGALSYCTRLHPWHPLPPPPAAGG